MNQKRKKKKNAKAKRWGVIVVIELLLIIILIPALYIYLKLSSVQEATAAEVDKSSIVINEDVDEITAQKLKGYKTVALFGLDAREEGGLDDTGSRSDAIMLVAIDNDKKEIKLLSVYRDTCVNVPDYGLEKITHAYAYGGAQLAMSTLNKNFDLGVTEFASVDFAVLANIIDAVGGLDIELTDAEVEWINECIHEQNRITGSDSPDIWESGMQHLDGTQATAYARIRKADSDFVRAERQRTVLKLIFEKARDINLKSVMKIMDTVLPEVYTNLSKAEMLSLANDLYQYKIVDSEGFPFEKTTGSLYYDELSYVFASDYLWNIKEMHNFLYSNDEYQPSATVQEISIEIGDNSGYY